MNTNVLAVVLQAGRDRRPTWAPGEIQAAILWVLVGCAVAFAVFRLVPRVPWPRPLRWRFVGFHLVAAPVAVSIWYLIAFPIETYFDWSSSGLDAFERFQEAMVVGCVFYLFVASLSYSAHGAARAAHAEAVAAQTQLATLRSQLQPHFLFNALHTVVQLIHIDPPRAADAAEMVADLLRRSLEEQRDEVPLGDEWRFVSRYLAVEQIRFGDRLMVKADIPRELASERVPSFALQTLVENAVQHGAAPRVAPTEIAITGRRSSSALVISVRHSGDRDASRTSDSGAGTGAGTGTGTRTGTGTGTGLARLRERLAVLYGGAATLVAHPMATGGYEAVLTVPRNRPSDV